MCPYTRFLRCYLVALTTQQTCPDLVHLSALKGNTWNKTRQKQLSEEGGKRNLGKLNWEMWGVGRCRYIKVHSKATKRGCKKYTHGGSIGGGGGGTPILGIVSSEVQFLRVN